MTYPTPAQIAADALATVPEADQIMVRLHRNFLVNTGYGRPSDALRRAVDDYHRGYRHNQ